MKCFATMITLAVRTSIRGKVFELTFESNHKEMGKTN